MCFSYHVTGNPLVPLLLHMINNSLAPVPFMVLSPLDDSSQPCTSPAQREQRVRKAAWAETRRLTRVCGLLSLCGLAQIDRMQQYQFLLPYLWKPGRRRERWVGAPPAPLASPSNACLPTDGHQPH